jgi:osmotically-inducible protein OsmY
MGRVTDPKRIGFAAKGMRIMHRSIQDNRRGIALAACLFTVGACTPSGRDTAERRDTAASDGAPNVVPSAKPAAKRSDLTDKDIRRAVVDELFRGPHVRAGALIVACQDGIVELIGTVDNLLAKDRAVAIAEGVKGVRAVSDRIRVEPVSRTDQELIRDVKNALLYDPATESYQVTVSATEGAVRLTGTVDSWQERRLAERLARGVRGVRAVSNDLAINVFKSRTDAEIKADVESRLRWDNFVNDGLVKVDVQGGAVRLSGVVGSATEKSEAYFASWVRGVRNVDSSKLQVEWWARDDELRKDKYAHKTNEQIASALKDALLYDPRVNSYDVTVHVDEGVVKLSGAVGSLKAKLAAESLAQHTVGVIRIENQISVKPGKPVADDVLAKRIEASFAANAVLDPSAVRVKVVNGKVTLTGRVPTLFESVEAADVANGLQGVTSVVNELKVVAPEVPFVWVPSVFPFGPYVEGWHYVAPETAQSDAAISHGIEQQLEWTPVIDPEHIRVEVHNGKAMLSGTVDSLRERQAAVESAFQAGAIAVEDHLKIG